MSHDQLLKVNWGCKMWSNAPFCFTNDRVTRDVTRIAFHDEQSVKPSECKLEIVIISYVITAANFFSMYKFFSISNNQHISERFFLDPAWLPSTRCKGNISRISLKIPPWSLDLSGWIKAPAKLELTKFITLPCSWESIPHTLVVVTIRMQTILNPKSSTFLDKTKRVCGVSRVKQI